MNHIWSALLRFSSSLSCLSTVQAKFIGGFRGGAEGAATPPPPLPLFFLYFENVLRFFFENRFIKCSLTLFFKTLTLLYFASRIRPQCCMLHALKSQVFIREGGGGGGRGGLGLLFLNFLDPPLQSYTLFLSVLLY